MVGFLVVAYLMVYIWISLEGKRYFVYSISTNYYIEILCLFYFFMIYLF